MPLATLQHLLARDAGNRLLRQFSWEHLEGGCRGAQHCSLLVEQPRELGASLRELGGGGILPCQG